MAYARPRGTGSSAISRATAPPPAAIGTVAEATMSMTEASDVRSALKTMGTLAVMAAAATSANAMAMRRLATQGASGAPSARARDAASAPAVVPSIASDRTRKASPYHVHTDRRRVSRTSVATTHADERPSSTSPVPRPRTLAFAALAAVVPGGGGTGPAALLTTPP